MIKRILERNSVRLLLCLLLVNTLALAPLLTTGYIADDLLNSQIRGAMIQTDRSLWGFSSYVALLWLRNEGRLIPLAFYAYSVFYFLKNVLLYKIFVLGVIVASIAAFFEFLKKLSKSELLAAIAVLLLPLMFQFRASWDPILAFCAQYPLITLLLFGSLNLFLRSLTEDNRRAFWLAVLLFLCGSLIFEVTYPMFLVYTLLAYLQLKDMRLAARKSWPFFAVTLCMALASTTFRAHAIAISPTYTMHVDWAIVVKTYFVQLLGAIPFSYFLFDPHAVFMSRAGRWPAAILQLLPLVVLVAAFSVGAVFRRLAGEARRQSQMDRGGILAVGILLLAIPPSLISLSPKFQAQAWGDAYLPVYMTCFGLSLVLAVGVEKLYWQATRLQRAGGWIAPLVFCVWLLLLGCAFRNNYLVSQALNKAVWSPRVLLEKALDRGLLSGISPKSVILVNGADPWDNANEYSMKTGLRLSIYPLNEIRDLTPVFREAGGKCASSGNGYMCEFAADSPVYTVQIRHLTDGTGAALLARVQTAYQANSSVSGLLSNEVTAYFRLPDSAQPLSIAFSGRDIEPKAVAQIFRVDGRNLQVLKEGHGWKLVRLQRSSAFDALSLRGEISAEHPGSSIQISKSRNEFELQASGPELLHAGYEKEDLGNGIEFPAVKFDNDMSVEVLVVPGDSQVMYADILSNHWVDRRGLAIEQVYTQTNHYVVSFSTGNGWIDLGGFALATGRRNYISLQMRNGEARLYLNGTPIARKILPEPLAESPYPVWVGNWKGRDRLFNGGIEEVLIARGAKSEEMVFRDAKRLARADRLSRPPVR